MPTDHTDDWFPVSIEEHTLQVKALTSLLADKHPASIIDVGCGSGRIASVLAEMGHSVVGVDSDQRALDACESHEGLKLLCTDVLAGSFMEDIHVSRFDVAICLGHTFMQFWRPAEAITLMRMMQRLVGPGGIFAIDALCEDIWRDVSEGFWQSGISEDGEWQMVWAEADNVIALRRDDEIDPESEEIHDRDRPMRLWSMGELALLAAASGWQPPLPDPTGALLLFHPLAGGEA